MILSNCDIASIKASRRPCKRLSELAAPHLFKEIHIGWFSFSLAKLQNIANHAVFCKLVHKLFFVYDPLYLFKSQAEWEMKVDLRPSSLNTFGRYLSRDFSTPPRHTLSNEQFRYHYGRYEHFRKDQLSLSAGNGGRLIQECVGKLIRLQEVSATGPLRCSREVDVVWQNLETEILVNAKALRDASRLENIFIQELHSLVVFSRD